MWYLMVIIGLLCVNWIMPSPALALNPQPEPPKSTVSLTPYFDMSLSEGVYIPNQGNFFSGGKMNTQVGLLTKIDKKNAVFGLYTLYYTGPGFQPQDSRGFQDRSISHKFNLEYKRQMSERLKIKPAISCTREYKKNGANESWDNGLYNMNSSGGQLAVDYNLEKNAVVTAQYLWRNMKFPNYTDLLREFQQSGTSSEISDGLQDQALKQFSLKSQWGNLFGGITHTWQDYKNEHVIESNKQYGNTLQKDTDTSIDLGFQRRLWILSMSPAVTYTKHRSNQNFLRFKFLGDTAAEFISQNYDYNELNLSVPVDLLITSKWAVSGALSMSKRDYTNRPPRDGNNNYNFSQKQSNTLTTISGGFRKRLNEIAFLRINYALIVGESNNKFEKYIPYNYTGNSLGITYQLAY